MTIEKRGNKYRIRYMQDGKQKSLTLDHKPTKREAELLVLEEKDNKKCDKSEVFEELAKEYMSVNSETMSPNTIKGYQVCLKRLSQAFLGTPINAIDQLTIQREINRLSIELSPKTVHNTHGFISSVLKMYRPELVLNTKLPQKKPTELYCPTKSDIEKILALAEPTIYYVPICLGIMGLRRGEICALTLADIEGNILSVNKTSVYLPEGGKAIKDTAKNDTSNRQIYIPDSLIRRITEQNTIYDGSASRLWQALQTFQMAAGVHQFRFHDLRAYFATYAHLQGIPDQIIQDTGGWKTDYTMKKIYRRSQKEEALEAQKNIWSNLV